VAKLREFGTCGCGRIIKPQSAHNDPTIWACIACGGPVCDWCYHMHHYEKHGSKGPGPGGPTERERREHELR
jgi:hypothetical protein